MFLKLHLSEVVVAGCCCWRWKCQSKIYSVMIGSDILVIDKWNSQELITHATENLVNSDFQQIVKWFRLIFTCLNPPWTQQLTRWLNKWRGISHHIHNSHEQILKCYWFWLFGWLNIAFNIEHKNIFLSSTWKWLRELVSLVQLLKFDSISSSWMYCLLYNQISHQNDDSLALSQLAAKYY